MKTKEVNFMKIILKLFLLIVTCSTVFSAEDYKEEKDLKIKFKVFESIKIEAVRDIDFGVIPLGKDNYAKTKGIFTVEGTPGAKVSMGISGTVGSNPGAWPLKSTGLMLYREGSQLSGKALVWVESGVLNGNSFIVPESGKQNFYVNASFDTRNIAKGEYTGTFIVSVQYE